MLKPSHCNVVVDVNALASGTHCIGDGVGKNKLLASLANMAVVKFQLQKLSKGQTPNPNVSPLRALTVQQVAIAFRTRQYRRWVAQRSAY